jgi:ubiquinone/menaquinone biosynthesis C-methylase UbiE
MVTEKTQKEKKGMTDFLRYVTFPFVWIIRIVVLVWSKWINVRSPKDLNARYQHAIKEVPFGASNSIFRRPEILEGLYRALSSVDPWTAKQVRNALDIQKTQQEENSRIAIIGIGSGKVALHIAHEFPTMEIVAMDILSEPVERLANLPERPRNLQAIIANGTDTHLPPHSLTALVIASGIVRYFNQEQRNEIVREAQRVLKNNGVFVIFDGLHRNGIYAFKETLVKLGWTVDLLEESLSGNFRNTIFLLAWILYQKRWMRRIINILSRMRKQDAIDILIQIAGHRRVLLFSLRALPPSH